MGCGQSAFGPHYVGSACMSKIVFDATLCFVNTPASGESSFCHHCAVATDILYFFLSFDVAQIVPL